MAITKMMENDQLTGFEAVFDTDTVEPGSDL
jgi:hypothetical protein